MNPPLMNSRRALDTLSRRLDQAAKTVPSILADLNERRARVGDTEGERSTKPLGTITDTTGRIASELAEIAAHEHLIANAIKLIARTIDHLDDTCRDSLGRRAPATEIEDCIGHPVGASCHRPISTVVTPAQDIVTNPNRLCDECEIVKRQDERRGKDAARKRLARV